MSVGGNLPSSGGSVSYSPSFVGDDTILTTQEMVIVTSSATITLPTALNRSNLITIKNIGTGVVTVDTINTETIDGDDVYILLEEESSGFASNGTNWISI